MLYIKGKCRFTEKENSKNRLTNPREEESLLFIIQFFHEWQIWMDPKNVTNLIRTTGINWQQSFFLETNGSSYRFVLFVHIFMQWTRVDELILSLLTARFAASRRKKITSYLFVLGIVNEARAYCKNRTSEIVIILWLDTTFLFAWNVIKSFIQILPLLSIRCVQVPCILDMISLELVAQASSVKFFLFYQWHGALGRGWWVAEPAEELHFYRIAWFFCRILWWFHVDLCSGDHWFIKWQDYQ